MKLIPLCLAAGALMFAGEASALCFQKPSEAKLKSTAVEELRKVSRAAANLYAEDIVVLEKKCDGLTGRGNTWKVSTPVGVAACSADDQMRGAACAFEPQDAAAAKARSGPAEK